LAAADARPPPLIAADVAAAVLARLAPPMAAPLPSDAPPMADAPPIADAPPMADAPPTALVAVAPIAPAPAAPVPAAAVPAALPELKISLPKTSFLRRTIGPIG